MEKINELKASVEVWAAERGQQHVAIEITEQFFLSPVEGIKLSPIKDGQGQLDMKAINNNRQQIFRWLRNDSKASERKVKLLAPIMLAALPADRKAKLEGDRGYLISRAINSFSDAIEAEYLKAKDRAQKWSVLSVMAAMAAAIEQVGF